MRVPIVGQSGTKIESIDDWELYASTKGKWQPGYSAYELARLWLGDDGPAAVIGALRNAMPGLTLERAQAEAQVAFDHYPGGKRNHDVLAWGTADGGPVVIGVEGKVNESLDATITKKYAGADAATEKGDTTNLRHRVTGLLRGIAGGDLDSAPELGELRYQLLTAIAGTVAAAEEDTVAAAVVIHLVATPNAKPEKFEETRQAVAALAVALGLDPEAAVLGPFTVDTTHLRGPSDLPCWLTVVETPPA